MAGTHNLTETDRRGGDASRKVGGVRRAIAAATLLAVPALIVACENQDDRNQTEERQEPNSNSTTSGVPQTSSSVNVPSSVAGGPAGQGSVPEQPGGTAQPQDSEPMGTTPAPAAG